MWWVVEESFEEGRKVSRACRSGRLGLGCLKNICHER